MPTSTEKIFAEFKEHSVAEFFKKNQQMLGFSGKTRSLTTIVHEYVTNSLDACEEAGILPEITITIVELDRERYRVVAEDNGPGIPEKHLGKALGQMLAGTKFHRYCQQRGQQGIGASGCTMYAQITTGKPVHVVSRYDRKRISCDLSIDLKSNSPRIANLLKEEGDFGSGLRVEAEVAEVKYDMSSFGVYEYIRRTALANPHLQITLNAPDGQKFTFPRSDNRIPPKPVVVQPHPLGLSTNDLIDFAHREKECRKISSFLQERFARLSASKVDELRALCPDVDFEKNPQELQWQEAEKIVKAIHNEKVKWIAPSTDSVIPIGREQIEKSLRNILAPEFVAVTERPPKIYKGGIPFMVEAAIAYGGGAGKKNGAPEGAAASSEIIRYANRAPLLFDNSGCAITEAVKGIDWKRYKLKDFEEEPISVFVNLCSVYVPYTSAGKQAIADEEEVVQEIRNAVMEAARELQRYLGGKHRERDRAERKKAVLRYVPQLSRDLVELAGKGDAKSVEKELVRLIETKYSGQIENGGDEEEEALEEPEEKGGKEGGDEEE
ncbi:MAG: DNA topoisomerase VI subunit B [Candidatus Micrarchaeota archaeon]|nr:DNA topoisomerase VI subunit B [Candidatus Micrarchaeota archaeon]